MAYRAFDGDSFVLETVPPVVQAQGVETFTPLELNVIALADVDHPGSVRESTRFGRFMERAFGIRRSNTLADPRLEALRRFAVLARHGGVLPPHEIDLFISAGFSLHQARALQLGPSANSVAEQ